MVQVPYANAVPDGMMMGFSAEAWGTSIPSTNVVDVLQSATGLSSQPPAPTTTRASTDGREKPEAPLVKPQRFDGRGSLDRSYRHRVRHQPKSSRCCSPNSVRNQAESFQARLKSRRRKEGETIQDLYSCLLYTSDAADE